MLKIKDKLYFSTKDIAEKLNKNPQVITTLFRKLNIKPVHTRILQSYKNSQYFWDDSSLTEEFFNEIKSHFKSYIEFISFFKNIIENYDAYLETEKQNKLKLKEESKKIKQQINDDIQNHLHDLWFNNNKTKYIIHCGPTNSGKSYNAIQSLKKCKSGAYLAPLRLLAWEVMDKINSEIPNICSLVTGEEIIKASEERIVSSTFEMYDYNKEYDHVIIDECLMLSDPYRGKNWLKAIIEAKAKTVHLITNNETIELIKNILTSIGRKYKVINYERLTPLVVDKTAPDKPYNFKEKTIYVVFDRISVLTTKSILEKKNNNVSVLYGNLPPEVRKDQMNKFISGENNLCISTDVIGMGVNLPCDRIVFLSHMKFDGKEERKLNSTEIKQIAGRAGRYKLSDEGRVCGADKTTHNHIMNNINTNTKIYKTYFGLDYNMFIKIPKETYSDKLRYFSDLNPIPDSLKHIIHKQDISNYFPLSDILDRFYKKFDYLIGWALLNSPVKQKLNINFFIKCMENISKKKSINIPYRFTKEVNDRISLADAESKISEYDLYLYFSNNKYISEFIKEVDLINQYREELIIKINEYLVNKKLTDVRRCKVCGDLLDNDYHVLCDECYYKYK